MHHILQPGRPVRAIVFYPNSGEEWDATNETWVEGTGTTAPKDFADGVLANVRSIQAMYEQSVGLEKPDQPHIFVGGCCRTTPDTIAAIRRRIDDETS